jgi:S1-C subfamily serine protease
MNGDSQQRGAAPRPLLGPGISLALFFAISLLAFSSVAHMLGWDRKPLYDPEARPATVIVRGDLTGGEASTIELFRAASPSVVHIKTRKHSPDPLRRDPTDMPPGTGSGFSWGAEGYIVTSYHVVASGDLWDVMLVDNSVWEARLVGVDIENDLAVLEISADALSLHPIQVGSSHDLVVGQSVFAIGNPFGFDQTLTSGVIGGLGRRIPGPQGGELEDVIQTDAAILPGNSGGPLLDSSGRLIGVNTAVAGDSGRWTGIGFAVPVDVVNEVVPRIIRGHEPARAPRVALGFYGASRSFSELQGVEGVIVERLVPGGLAEQLGLRPLMLDAAGEYHMDVIVRVGEHEVRSHADLLDALQAIEPGSTLELGFLRDGVAQTASASL